MASNSWGGGGNGIWFSVRFRTAHVAPSSCRASAWDEQPTTVSLRHLRLAREVVSSQPSGNDVQRSPIRDLSRRDAWAPIFVVPSSTCSAGARTSDGLEDDALHADDPPVRAPLALGEDALDVLTALPLPGDRVLDASGLRAREALQCRHSPGLAPLGGEAIGIWMLALRHELWLLWEQMSQHDNIQFLIVAALFYSRRSNLPTLMLWLL